MENVYEYLVGDYKNYDVNMEKYNKRKLQEELEKDEEEEIDFYEVSEDIE